MNMNRPLFWHQGLMLQPHHFQNLDLYHQSLLTPFYRFLQPFFWGVANLEIQESALNNRSFDLIKGEFLLPDQTYISIPGNAVIEARTFDEDWLDGEKPLTVYLGLRKLNPSGENVTVVDSLDRLAEVPTRFVTTADSEDVADLHQKGPTAQLQWINHVVKVFWESEIDQLGDFILLPVARIERFGEEFQLSGSFVPPSLKLSASGILKKTIKDIRDQVASRSNQLEAYKKQRGIQTAEFGARDMVYLLALRTLNRYIPLLFHFADNGVAHPWTLYGVLRQMIGELSAFSVDISATGETEKGEKLMPDYDHGNLWQCFEAAQALVTRLLDEITAGPDYVLALLFDGTYFAVETPPAMFEGRNRFYLVFETEEEPQTVSESVDSIAKLGTRETLPILIARALPGIGLTHLQVPPQELPRRAGAMYYQIDHHGDQWAQVQKGLNLALYWDSAPEDLKIELMVVGRS